MGNLNATQTLPKNFSNKLGKKKKNGSRNEIHSNQRGDGENLCRGTGQPDWFLRQGRKIAKTDSFRRGKDGKKMVRNDRRPISGREEMHHHVNQHRVNRHRVKQPKARCQSNQRRQREDWSSHRADEKKVHETDEWTMER